MVNANEAPATHRPLALITGASRGIGAATAYALAERGYDIAFTYRNKAARAADVAATLNVSGAAALPLACDLTRPADLDHFFAALTAWPTWSGAIHLLILNASGGLERDALAADPTYPMRINRDAQLAVVERALPLMPPGASIVFITSHWATLYGQVEQLPAYGAVAESKHAGEHALRARQSAFAAAGLRLLIVTGDLIDGSITPKLLERASPGLAADRRETVGALPTADDMGRAIAAAATDPSLLSGSTIVVGGALASLPRLTSPV